MQKIEGELKHGDTIKCLDAKNMKETMACLKKQGYRPFVMDHPKAEVKAKPKPKKKKEVDSGKIKALRKAGWSMTKIADEMRCSISTVSRYCQENAA